MRAKPPRLAKMCRKDGMAGESNKLFNRAASSEDFESGDFVAMWKNSAQHVRTL